MVNDEWPTQVHVTNDSEQDDDDDDDGFLDTDSALGSDLESTQSLTSSVLDYTYENGRRYHAFRDGRYFLPNDEQEQEALDLMHHICRLVLRGELFHAPVTSPTSILDVGTGTGIWAIEVADLFPEAAVLATDLSPIQPLWVPPNLQFEIDDCESEWTFSRKFDFVHMRNLTGSIADWPQLLSTAYDHLAPGSWIEVSNIIPLAYCANDSLADAPATLEWRRSISDAARATGRELNVCPQIEKWVRDAGFEEVREYRYQVPISSWKPGKRNRELAAYFQALVMMELEPMSLRLFTQVLGWSPEQLRAILVDVRKEIKDTKLQFCSDMCFVLGKKPDMRRPTSPEDTPKAAGL